MRDPAELVEILAEVQGDDLVLLEALDGFIDAGQAVRLAREHLLGSFAPELVARFDLEELVDHRARRPRLVFDTDRWTSYEPPTATVHRLHDAAGTAFLLLSGLEPDLQWERFVAAVTGLIDRFGVRLTIGLHSVPWAVAHTRPVAITSHGQPRELLPSPPVTIGRVEVPASVGHLLEYRLGEQGRGAIGLAAHTPYYLAAVEYPASTAALLGTAERIAGLSLALEPVRARGNEVQAEVDSQLADDEQAQSVIAALDRQVEEPPESRLPLDARDLPTGEGLGAEFERFLAERGRQDGESLR